MEVISVENISKGYGAHKALADFSLSIPQGKIFGLLGPNGAGKTTFIRMITGILAPDKGRILYKEQEFNSSFQSRIGYLPEERGLYKKMKVKEHLMYLARLKGIDKVTSEKRVTAYLEKLALVERKNAYIEELSKGMQQKVQFIAAVIHDPELIILDEPFSGFDPINADLLKNEVLSLQSEGKSIVFSTHRMESVEELCEEIALVNKGILLYKGKVKSLKSQNKTGRLHIHGQGSLNDNSKVYRILKQIKEAGHIDAVIQPNQNVTTNEILLDMIPQFSIASIKEEETSMHDIFVSMVKTSGDE